MLYLYICCRMSGLHQATLTGNVEIMRVLLDNGATVDLKDNKGMRPIHHAARHGLAQPVSVLLEYNCSVNDSDDQGQTPLHLACQYGHVQVVSTSPFLIYVSHLC